MDIADDDGLKSHEEAPAQAEHYNQNNNKIGGVSTHQYKQYFPRVPPGKKTETYLIPHYIGIPIQPKTYETGVFSPP